MSTLVWRLVTAVVLVMGSAPALAATPSFPCPAGLIPTEMTICADEDLAALDRRLATAYRNKFDGLPIESSNALDEVVRSLVLAQKAWIAHRNSCGTDRTCIRRAYVTRTRALTAGDNDKDGPCSDVVGAEQAAVYVAQCKAVATETHPPCNAQNSCELIISHNIYRCGALGAGAGNGAPKFCASYRIP